MPKIPSPSPDNTTPGAQEQQTPSALEANEPPRPPEPAKDSFSRGSAPGPDPKFLPGTPVWTCSRSALDILWGNPGQYHHGVVQASSSQLPHQRKGTLPDYTLTTEDGGTNHFREDQLRSARPLTEDAWTEPTEPGTDFRSRYSGAPLRPNHGVITIVSQLSQAVAHSYVVFEWYDPYEDRRHHVLYHLFPSEHEGTHTEPTLWEKFTWTPGTVEKLVDSHHFFPGKDAEGEVIPAGYRSWETSYACMAKGIDLSEAFHQSPPLYSAHGYSGTESCSTMGTRILRAAGIETRSVLGTVLEVPRYENATGSTIDTEVELWSKRYGPLTDPKTPAPAPKKSPPADDEGDPV